MLFIAILFMIFVCFFTLTMFVNYFFIFKRNFKKTILVSILMTIISIISHFLPMIFYQTIF
ncbi:hypothetical protein XBJ2_2370003 [Xenorhabdus bovienii str. Jollieti]|uniref:Uncharacterized protein n=1 Tax=Xenorhabdus bovienii (strain SS-2004) TaxID=406818 RepID=D3V774_XENBS|nr:hypothetical protein XBJ1_4400 [Xenorhabdus bovienii SS-2004]CDH29238.1 hypothetical protein XBJ2_2370003 [Xenorhabdus bovienii str. Jollieti]